MALYISGGAVGGAASGALGATVFSHGRFGPIMRARVIPTNPATTGQVLARNRMSSLTNHWYNTLTAAQRDAWTTYAENVPVTNRIGAQIYLTGLNWYVGCNSLRSQAAGTIVRVDDAPTIFNLSTFDLTEIIASESTQAFSVTFPAGAAWTLDDGALMCWGARPQNASINFNNQPYRYAGATYGDTVTPPPGPGVYPSAFPFVEGQKLFCRFNCIEADGRIGAEQKYNVIAIS